jgi:DNA-binding MarR family transcriptional regulator
MLELVQLSNLFGAPLAIPQGDDHDDHNNRNDLMTDDSAKIVNEYLMRMAENLPLLERFTLDGDRLGRLSVTELHTIALVGRLGSPKMSELAQRGHVTRGTITFMIDKLAKKGYVKRVRGETDGRVVRVSLTARGQKANKLHEEFHQNIINSIMASLAKSERKQLASLMKKIVMAFDPR